MKNVADEKENQVLYKNKNDDDENYLLKNIDKSKEVNNSEII